MLLKQQEGGWASLTIHTVEMLTLTCVLCAQAAGFISSRSQEDTNCMVTLL